MNGKHFTVHGGVFALLLSGVVHAQTWTPPRGIPAPQFGIAEQAPARPSPWNGDTAGFYYVDPGAGCSDSHVRGFPGSARCTIPSTLPAGAVVELHGTFNNALWDFNWIGTAAQPIFIRGQSVADRPLITQPWGAKGAAYVVLENLRFAPASESDQEHGFYVSEGTRHVALRDIEISGNDHGGGIGIGTWDYTGSATADHIVVQRIFVHDLGIVSGATGDRDYHCITVNGSVNTLWVLDSMLTACEGDGMQIEAQHGRGIDKIHHVYFGRNHSFGNKQSAFGLKHATDVIVSENHLHGIHESSSAPGACVGTQYNPQRAWFLFNTLHDCEIGFFLGSDDGPGDGTEIFYVGNLIYDIHSPEDPTSLYDAGAFALRGGISYTIVGNTLHDIDAGINSPPSGGEFHIHDNIIAGRAASGGSEIAIQSSVASSSIDNNLFFSAAGIRLEWGNIVSTTPQLGAQCGACLAADPQFIAVPGNLHVQAGSPAIDAGALHPVYAAFQSRYGVSIDFDLDGVARSQGARVDIGAYEHGADRIFADGFD